MILSDDPTDKQDEQENEANSSNAEESNDAPEDKVEETKEEAPATEEVKEEAPVAEEAKEEAPVAEEAKEEAPAAEEAKKEEPAAEEVKEEAPVAEEAKKEEPVAEAKAEAPKEEKKEEPVAQEEAPVEEEEPKEVFNVSLKDGHVQISLGTVQHPEFKAGDTITVHYKIKEGEKERIQLFKGVVLQRKGSGSSTETVTIRKVSGGIGVERIIPLGSPFIEKIEVHKHGRVRRARIFYLRDRKGKSARIGEKRS